MNRTVQRDDKRNGIYLYVLELQSGKFYVGMTNNPERRFKQHREGKSVEFVRKNLPIINTKKTLLNTTDRKRAEELETKKTIELIQKYDIYHVCGGKIVGDLHDRIWKFKLHFQRLMISK